jgi:hypothetical protein
MSNYTILPEILLAVMLASAFGILFLTVLKIVRKTGLFQGKTAIVFSLLISTSAIAACAQLLVMPNNIAGVERNIALNYSLLPAMTLAGLIVILELFVIAATPAPSKEDEVPAKKPEHPSTKPPKSPGRPKKEKAADKESKEVSKPVGGTS